MPLPTGTVRAFRARAGGMRFAPVARSALFYLLLYGFGIVIGGILFFAFPAWVRGDLAHQIHLVLQHIAADFAQGDGGAGNAAFLDAFYAILIVLFIWFSGHLPMGAPIVICTTFVRALSLGLALAVTIAAYGWRGVGFDLLGVIPWNILSGGGIVLVATASSLLAGEVRRGHGSTVRESSYLAYSFAGILAVLLVFSAGWIQAATVPRVLALFAMSAP